MEHRGIEYTVVQGIERGVWKWSASVAGAALLGKKDTRSEAVAAAEKAIDRALASKRERLDPRGGAAISTVEDKFEGDSKERE
jgi:hypothetical protein